MRKKNEHRMNAIEELSKILAETSSIQLGFDGKKVLGRERYVFNGIFVNEVAEREDCMIGVKSFPGSVGGLDVMDELKSIDERVLVKVAAVVADTTSLNTGCNTGVFRLLKDYFKSKFNRDILTLECLLHMVELLFRHFFLEIEGPSKAPDKLPKGSFYNIIGKFEHSRADFQPGDNS